MADVHRSTDWRTDQEDMNKYRGTKELCSLCWIAMETMYHFLYECPQLVEIRNKYLPQLKQVVIIASSQQNWYRIQNHQDLKEKLLIEPDSPELDLDEDSSFQIRSITRRLTYVLHCERANILITQAAKKGQANLQSGCVTVNFPC